LNLIGRKWQEAGENYILRSVIIYRFHQILLYGDQIKEDEMSGACSTHGTDK